MKKLICTIARFTMIFIIGVMLGGLTGCSGIQLGHGKASGDTAFGVGGMADSNARSGMTAWKNSLPPQTPYYKDEKPRIAYVPIRPSVSQAVEVFDETCVGGDGGAYYVDNPGVKQVFLCGRKGAEAHELKHAAGMTHTGWACSGGTCCAVITEAGYNTGYVKDQRICRANDHEWTEK